MKERAFKTGEKVKLKEQAAQTFLASEGVVKESVKVGGHRWYRVKVDTYAEPVTIRGEHLLPAE